MFQHSLYFKRWLWATVVLFIAYTQINARTITLKESLEHAFAHNETVLLANENLEKSQQQIRQAAADAFPQVDLSLSYTRNWLLPSFFFNQQQITVGAHNNVTSTLGFRQTLYSGGKTFAALRIARQFKQYSEETLRATRQQVHTQVETAFYDLLLAQELLRVSKASVNRARANQDRVERLRNAGRVSDYDLLRAQVQVAELLTDSIRTQNTYALANLAFKNQIGFAPNEPVIPQGTFRQTTDLTLDQGEEPLIALSMQKQPTVRQQKLEVSMREQAETVAKASSRPSVNLIVNGQWEAQKNGFDFRSSDFRQSWLTGVSVSIPLFDGMRTRSQVAQARSDTRQAQLLSEQTERNTRLQVMQAWRNFLETRARQKAQTQAVALARRGREIAESRYAGGVGTQLEVIDGQLTLQRAEAELARAQRDLAVAIVQLEHSTGILGEHTPSGNMP